MDDEAVSPTVGVILMVVVVVALSATVMLLVSNQSTPDRPPIAALRLDENRFSVDVFMIAGQSIDDLSVRATVDGVGTDLDIREVLDDANGNGKLDSGERICISCPFVAGQQLSSVSVVSGNTAALSWTGSIVLPAGNGLSLQGEGDAAGLTVQFSATGAGGTPNDLSRDLSRFVFTGMAGQDLGGTATVEDGVLTMLGNTWKRISLPYTVTQDTILEFDFRSDAEGELHTIGFSTANRPDRLEPLTYTKVYGTQNWGGIRESYDGGWQSYSIDIGNQFTGDWAHMVFGNDKDSGVRDNHSQFRNVILRESWEDGYEYSWDFGDGSFSSERNPEHTYASSGTYDVVVRVSDADGALSIDSFQVTV